MAMYIISHDFHVRVTYDITLKINKTDDLQCLAFCTDIHECHSIVICSGVSRSVGRIPLLNLDVGFGAMCEFNSTNFH
jgi:hypothetical protein